MTFQNSTTDKKSAGFMPLFSFSTKQFWTTILLFTIILFFVLPVPILMMISDRAPISVEEIVRLKRDLSEDWVSGIRYAVIAIMSVFGVVLSISRFKYLKNKVSIDFYHSLPIKRGQLFLTQLGVSAISLLIPYIFNILFTLTVIASNGLITDALLAGVLVMTAESLIYTVFFYALSTLVGMVSGLGAVHLTLTLVAVFIVPAVYISTLGFINIFNENMWFSYYANMGLFEKLSPIFRFIFNTEPLFVWEAVVMLLFSAIILTGAYFIYMQRKSERAGTPVVFPVLGEIIKYILVFLGTILGGLLFYYIMDSFFWTVFGMICGMVLVFMLTNTILHKTARSMFKGWKGLCIFAVCAAVSFTALVGNFMDINTRIPESKNISRVAVNFNGAACEMEFRDPEVIDALRTIYTDSAWEADNRSYRPSYWYDYTYLEIVFYPKFGIPTAKTVRLYNKSAFVEEFRTMLDSEEFKVQYLNIYDELSDDAGYLYVARSNPKFYDDGTVFVNYGSEHWNYENFNPNSVQAKRFGLEIITEENKACNFEFFQQPSFGKLFTRERMSAKGINIQLLNSMDDLISYYTEHGVLNYTPEESVERLTEVIDEIEIYKDNRGEELKMTVTDKAQIREILLATANPFGDSHSVYTFVEPEYYATYSLNVSEDYVTKYYYDEYGNEYVTTEPSVDKETGDVTKYERTYELAFLLGKIPEFVTNKLK